MSWKRAPVPLARAVEALAARVEPLTTLARVQRAWPEAAALFARHAEPVAERGGVVTVRCASGVWAQELGLQANDVVARLNAVLGAPVVVELQVRGPAGARRRR